MNTIEYIEYRNEEMKITVEWEMVSESIDTDRGTYYEHYYEPISAENENGDIWEAGFDYPKRSWQGVFEEELVNNRIEYFTQRSR